MPGFEQGASLCFPYRKMINNLYKFGQNVHYVVKHTSPENSAAFDAAYQKFLKGSEVDRKLSCGNIQKYFRACNQLLGQGRTVHMQVTSQMRQTQTGKGEVVARKVCGVVGVILEGCFTNRPPKEMNKDLRGIDLNPFRPRRSIYD